MEQKSGSLFEWIVPLGFIVCAGWLIWHFPAFVLDWLPPTDSGDFNKLAALFARHDVSGGFPSLFGDYTDFIDWVAVLGLATLTAIGVRTVRRAPMEFESWTHLDRFSVFIGRVTMMLVICVALVMMYEVILRYVFEAPTLWANEMSLWLAGFVFLCAGLYAMQQRSHIRIFILYDVMPKGAQKACDVISTFLIVLFAFFLVYGGYKDGFGTFYRWETFGTAFDPPIPATLKPAVLIVVSLVAVQAVINLFSDWNAEPVIHTAADDIDQDELERLRASVGAEGTGDLDVTRGSVQGNQTKADG
ncbi:MAG: TRAP transporter small permease [Pseudomonadota bacterium]